jgi:hypothetical protein
MLADKTANLREVHIGEASVVRPPGCHHHVVDCREVTEEPIESNRIRGIEGRRTNGINLAGSALEALGIPHLGPFCTCTTCRFESDASATADHNNGLPKELRSCQQPESYARLTGDVQYSFCQCVGPATTKNANSSAPPPSSNSINTKEFPGSPPTMASFFQKTRSKPSPNA